MKQDRYNQDLINNLRDALNIFSVRNRNKFIFLLLYQITIIVSTLNVRDEDLLLPESRVQLPVIGMGLSVQIFILIAPLVLVLLHINMLSHMSIYMERIASWRRIPYKHKHKLEQLVPTLFDLFIIVRGEWKRECLIAFIYTLLLALPTLVLALILYRFADYQNFLLSWYHFILLAIAVIASCLHIQGLNILSKFMWLNKSIVLLTFGLALIYTALLTLVVFKDLAPIIKSERLDILARAYNAAHRYAIDYVPRITVPNLRNL